MCIDYRTNVYCHVSPDLGLISHVSTDLDFLSHVSTDLGLISHVNWPWLHKSCVNWPWLHKSCVNWPWPHKSYVNWPWPHVQMCWYLFWDTDFPCFRPNIRTLLTYISFTDIILQDLLKYFYDIILSYKLYLAKQMDSKL